VPPRRSLPNSENASKEELDKAIRLAGKSALPRLLAMRALMLGVPFDLAAQTFNVCERTLQRWIFHWNRFGIDGLLDEERTGRPKKLAARESELATLAHDPSLAGRAHWTGVRFHGHLREAFGIEVSYSTVIRFFHEQRLALKVPQPWPDRQDEEKRAAFVKELSAHIDNEDIELWFGDETGIEGDPRPRRRWAKVGTNPRVTKNGDHLRMNVCGIVAPRTGEAFLMEFTHSDRDTFQVFLEEANKALVPARKRQILILDNASWHKGKMLNWGRFEPLFLPPYSPDLNPIEKLWRIMKAEWFTNFHAKNLDHLIEHLDKALLWLIQRRDDNVKTCTITTRL
jgi:transposase